MARFYKKIPTRIQQFIKAQKMFFVATAPAEGRVNLSPKGMDSFHIIDEHQVAWLSVTGSGNETSAHLLENGRITLMFCAFEGAPNIVRLYGTGKEILPSDAAWEQYKPLFPDYPGMRQIFLISVASVQTSCGSSIPFTTIRESAIDSMSGRKRRAKKVYGSTGKKKTAKVSTVYLQNFTNPDKCHILSEAPKVSLYKSLRYDAIS